MLNGPRTLPNTFTTASTTPSCSAGTSDLPVIGATRGMMSSFPEGVPVTFGQMIPRCARSAICSLV